MVLIDYSKKRADATPAGNKAEIPRRHNVVVGSGGGSGGLARLQLRRVVSENNSGDVTPSSFGLRPNPKNGLKSHMERLQQAQSEHDNNCRPI